MRTPLRQDDRAGAWERQAIVTRLFARSLWRALAARPGLAAEALLEREIFCDSDLQRVVNRTFDAAETVFERHGVAIEPCRKVLDGDGMLGGPAAIEMYLGRWPDGSTRNLTRDQVLMMAGFDLDPAGTSAVDAEVPF